MRLPPLNGCGELDCGTEGGARNDGDPPILTIETSSRRVEHKKIMTSNSYFDSYASLYDQLQPVLIENYRTYNSLALDFVPGGVDSEFRILDLGCGTGTFLDSVIKL